MSILRCALWSSLFACLFTVTPLLAQESADDDDGGFGIRDSDVGYIDPAVIGNFIRIRGDAGYNFDRPNRAEYFYARAQPSGSGLMAGEREVAYQDLALYVEKKTSDWFSAFVQVGLRSLNPDINDNTTGLGDVNAGMKAYLWHDCNSLVTAQLRVYAPSGDAARGLGTGNTSLEPALLAMHRWNNRITLSGELRYWTALSGSDIAGEVLQYGVGAQYNTCSFFNPVVEFVGWTVLDGGEAFLLPSGAGTVSDAEGTTIINAKIGGRVLLYDDTDLYVGYGRALTTERWYEDILRIELRYAF